MKRADIVVGMQVRVKKAVNAYYSNYAGRPEITLFEDMVATVGAVNCPCVVGPRKSFICVDWYSELTKQTERAGVDYANVVRA